MNASYKLIFFVPVADADRVKNSVFKTGAGHLGNYANCSFETRGVGQFMPLIGSDPYLGSQNKLEKVDELKVEILCTESNIKAAVTAMKTAHPYEEVAYEVYKLECF